MRRDCTPTWIDGQGRLRPLLRVALADRGEYDEAYLQGMLHARPELLPVEELDGDFAPLVSLGREIAAIDNLFVSPSGKLTLVETKLWRNREATREVIAQVIDYAACVSSWSYEELEQNCRRALSPAPLASNSLYELVRARFPEATPGETEFHDSVQRSLKNGRFLLLVVGDGIREGLESMVDYLHSQPGARFKFGLVELQVFTDPGADGGRLVVPHVLVNSVEIVRAVVLVDNKGGGHTDVSVRVEESDIQAAARQGRHTLSEEEFYQKMPDPESAAVVRDLLSRACELGAILEWRAGGVSVRLRDPGGTKQKLTLFVVTTRAEIYTRWLWSQLESVGVDTAIAEDWVGALVRLFPGTAGKPGYPDELARNIRIADVESVLDDLVEKLGETIEAIRTSFA
jgi:hypothetical protein